MVAQRSRHLVCCLTLPRPLWRSTELTVFVSQMLAMHSGLRRVTVKATVNRRAVQVFTTSPVRAAILRLAIDTNREDWYAAGIREIKFAA